MPVFGVGDWRKLDDGHGLSLLLIKSVIKSKPAGQISSPVSGLIVSRPDRDA